MTSRAAGAYLGIWGNSAEEYLGVGYPGEFEGPHTITFTSRPPVGAFWSITLYTREQLLYDNPINRYAISSRDVPAQASSRFGSSTRRQRTRASGCRRATGRTG